MKRSAGVTASAVLVIIGSLTVLLFALFMFLAMVLENRQATTAAMPSFVRISLALTGVGMLGLAVWGVATAVGLFRLRPWGRVSMLVFSGILAFFCGTAALIVSVAPMPPPQNAPPVTHGIRVFIAIFYGLLALLGGGWLYYFHRAKTKAQFSVTGEREQRSERSRPLSITIIGGFLLLSGLMLLVLAVRPWPATFLGLIVSGQAARFLYVAYGGLALWLGVGVLRLQPLTRKVAIGYFAFLGLSSVLFVVLPGYAQRIAVSLAVLPSNLRPVQIEGYSNSMIVMLLMGVVYDCLPIWFLVTRRNAFELGATTASSR